MPLSTQFSSSDEWSATALHELVHWTAKRVDRDCSKYSFDTDERAMEELVAELGSMFLSMALKINGSMDKNNLAYINNWKSATKGKNCDRFIYKACSLAEKACKFLIPDFFKSNEETTVEAKEGVAA
jgi:antirestriction protein ArdC